MRYLIKISVIFWRLEILFMKLNGLCLYMPWMSCCPAFWWDWLSENFLRLYKCRSENSALVVTSESIIPTRLPWDLWPSFPLRWYYTYSWRSICKLYSSSEKKVKFMRKRDCPSSLVNKEHKEIIVTITKADSHYRPRSQASKYTSARLMRHFNTSELTSCIHGITGHHA